MLPITNIVVAGDGENPEIEDPEGDVVFFLEMFSGSFINKFCKHIDIIKAWFFENPDEPEILYATLKVKEYKSSSLMIAYEILWYHNGVEYDACTFISRNKDIIFSGLKIQGGDAMHIENFFTINEEENTITFAIPKKLCGNLDSGDVISYPTAVGAICVKSEILVEIISHITGGNAIFIDITWGSKDYTIQY
jgi:hypothetical protein